MHIMIGKKTEFVFAVRPLRFFFIKNWYSRKRWSDAPFWDGRAWWKYKLIDIGSVTIGMAKKS
jgi:hypothetical protein